MIKLRQSYSLVLTLMLAACGGGGGGGGNDGSGGGVVPPANTSPVLDSIGDQQVFEGTSAVVTSLSASDADGDALSFALSGADAAVFEISSDRELITTDVFDFEAPGDADQDNAYEVTVTVSDGTASDAETILILVLDALEGRVVDGPVGGAAIVVIDASGSGALIEPVETDEDGFWIVPEALDIQTADLQVTSTGGVDTATGKDLGNLVLISDVPANVAGSINVNAITTILSVAETPEQKAEVLASLGIDATPEELTGTDIWESATGGNAEAQAAQRVNAQLNLIILTAQTIISSATGDQFDSQASVLAVAKAVVDAVSESDEIDLASSDVVAEVITDAVDTAAPEAEVSEEIVEVVSDAVADANTVLGDESLDPTSDTAAGVSGAGQDGLQDAVEDVSSGQTDVGTFEEETAPEVLYEDVPVEDDVPDSDGDGLADTVDPDDDNDGVRDGDDAFPLDPAEAIDTDDDGIGNNADTDDDGDGVADADDAFPLDPYGDRRHGR